MEVARDVGNLEDQWQSLFGGSVSGTGEEELLRLASSFSLQFSAKQIRIVLWLSYVADCHELAVSGDKEFARKIRHFIDVYKAMKQYNNSDVFVMRALESISLRKFINENSLRINVEKK